MRKRLSAEAQKDAEILGLKARLQEAEQTLDAIRSGSVDALVIAGPEGERVFTLEGADYRYRRLVETMKEGAAILSAAGLVVYANERLAVMLGVPLARLLGCDVGAHVAGASRAAFQAILREGVTQSSKTEVVFVRGSARVPTYVSATPTGDDDGGVCVVVTDLTEQKRSEEILAAERLATSILEQAAEAVVVCDPEGRIVRASRAAIRLAEQNPLFRPFSTVFPIRFHDGTDHQDLLALALRGDVVSGAAARLAQADRATKHLVVSAAPLSNVKHRTIGCVVSLTDVTERKRAEESIQILGRASVALGGSFHVPTMIDSLVSVIVPSFADMCAIYTHPADRRRTDVLGAGLVDPEAQRAFREALEEAAATNPPLDESMVGIPHRIEPGALNGDPFVAVLRSFGARSIMSAPLRLHRRTFGGILVARRETQDAFADENLLLFDELAIRAATAIDNSKLFDLAQTERRRVEEANRAKDEFLASVSHELRTPLNAILGWARLLRQREIADEKRDRAIATIERNAVMQAQLIDDLLDISRIVSGTLRLEQRTIDLAAVVHAAIDSVRPIAEAKNVGIHDAVEERACWVEGDPDRLQQVVWNLLTNAVKFTPSGGNVSVELRCDERETTIAVSDDGRGIGKEFLPHVFERFRQAEGGSTRTHGGLGIGLTIVKNLVDLHRGTVSAHSDGVGHGSRFVVTLPTVQKETSTSDGALDGAARDGADLEGARLLVVDDDADGREMVAELLRGYQAEVHTADSSRGALAMLQDSAFDALLSDISMPGEDGFSLVAQLRKLPKTQNGSIPALALTANARADDRARALRSGFDAHVKKPIDPDELLVVLSGFLHPSTTGSREES